MLRLAGNVARIGGKTNPYKVFSGENERKAAWKTYNNNNNNNNNNKLQLGCHPVAVVILHVNKT